MPSQRRHIFSAARRQHLMVEFSSLKYACPHGVFMSLTPGDPTLWSGVMFVRKGPYAPAILRFQISFPPTYPALPPLVTFSTDIFHPLITPLTTYMYTTDIQDSGTVSATDEERLPPGGFSLRDGFPGWFGRASKRSAERERAKQTQTPVRERGTAGTGSASDYSADTPGTEASGLSATPGRTLGGASVGVGRISTYEVLRYIRSSFDDEEVLDKVPFEAAGNPGAWQAWRAYRAKSGKIISEGKGTASGKREKVNWHDGLSDDEENSVKGTQGAPQKFPAVGGAVAPTAITRTPGQWNWDGVWEVRVKKGIDGSLAEAVLFGNVMGSDDLIQFLNMEDDEIQSVKENLQRSVETVEPQRRGVV